MEVKGNMKRLTTNKDVQEMGMVELAHNSCYVKDGAAWYRDFSSDMDARGLARKLLKDFAEGDDSFTCDEDFDEYIAACLEDGMDSIEGLIALFYRNLWAMADLRERLAEYEDLEEQKRLIKLPCAVGYTVYTNDSRDWWYLSKEDRPYEVKVDFIGITRAGNDNFINVVFTAGQMSQFKFSDIGKTVFLTREEAEAALEELRDKKG